MRHNVKMLKDAIQGLVLTVVVGLCIVIYCIKSSRLPLYLDVLA